MATNAGVWIDHKQAVVVLITDQGAKTSRITSGGDQQGRFAVRSRSIHAYGPRDFVPEDRLERKAASALNKYYDEIIACLREAEAILILGPGEAKEEFKKRIQRKKLRGRIAPLETADKLTNHQIAANVRRHFAVPPGTGKRARRARKQSQKSRSPNPGRVPRDVGGEG
jgi:hypothetical protein